MTDAQFNACWIESKNYTDMDAYLSDMALSSIWGDADDADVPSDRLEDLRKIWLASSMSMRDIRSASGMTQAKFAEHFSLPKRTVESWDEGQRVPPEYVKIMMAKLMGLL